MTTSPGQDDGVLRRTVAHSQILMALSVNGVLGASAPESAAVRQAPGASGDSAPLPFAGRLAQLQEASYTPAVATVSEQLRKALDECGQSRAEVSRATGIDQAVLSRFRHGQSLRGENLDRLADYLGLELRPKARRRRKGR